ncbi:hypothetical protein DPMN_095279 [Dreissena polymorpha]|uniref:Uncharacterized protein n=1 Tax=Dreissena polymorpha TaxID=45954 RepID=A0A9D4L954_DREPO|nr:hypothetical protein DPMN_095279 [Dreissena polymorpha]
MRESTCDIITAIFEQYKYRVSLSVSHKESSIYGIPLMPSLLHIKIQWARIRERESTMTIMRQYDDDSATIRWRECENAMARMRKRHTTMTTMRQCDDDSATIRWRQCDSTIAIMQECENARER